MTVKTYLDFGASIQVFTVMVHIQEAHLLHFDGVFENKVDLSSADAVIGRVVRPIFVNDENTAEGITVGIGLMRSTTIASTRSTSDTVSVGRTKIFVTAIMAARSRPISNRHGGIKDTAAILRFVVIVETLDRHTEIFLEFVCDVVSTMKALEIDFVRRASSFFLGFFFLRLFLFILIAPPPPGSRGGSDKGEEGQRVDLHGIAVIEKVRFLQTNWIRRKNGS